MLDSPTWIKCLIYLYWKIWMLRQTQLTLFYKRPFRLDLTRLHSWVICLWFSCTFLALTLQGHLGNPIRWGLKDPPVLLGGDSLYFSEASVDWNHWCQSSFWPRWVISPNFVTPSPLPIHCLLFPWFPWKQEIRKDTFHSSREFLSLFFWGNKNETFLLRSTKPWMRFVMFYPYNKNN